ncbi:hypothetical protein BDW75DRAFT_205150 [Aspergillus navahoensis]
MQRIEPFLPASAGSGCPLSYTRDRHGESVDIEACCKEARAGLFVQSRSFLCLLLGTEVFAMLLRTPCSNVLLPLFHQKGSR